MTVSAATQFSADAATTIGSNGGEGWLTIKDPLSTYTALGQLDVGTTGTGRLEVQNGGSLVTGNNPVFARGGLVIGWGAGSSGDVTVTGTGSEIVNVGQFNVGGSGNAGLPTGGLGSLLIEASGLVQTGLPASGYTGPAADIAADPGTDGSAASVTGAGSTWKITGQLLVGDQAKGSLAITAGGSVTASGLNSAVNAAGAAVLSVAGTGSNLTVAGQLSIGDAGAASLSIYAGGLVRAANADLGVQAGAWGISTSKVPAAS